MTTTLYWTIALVAAGLGCATPAFGDEPARPFAAAPAAAGKIVVHLDEEGNPVVPDPEELSPPDKRDGSTATASNNDDAPPPPELQPAPGGGEMILLDDRFRHDTVAHRSLTSTTIDCAQAAAASTGDSTSPPPHASHDGSTKDGH